ncbi:MAG: LCP family protein [Leptolinea sp.]|nr:LCP family protein [Leptolinea sp.]
MTRTDSRTTRPRVDRATAVILSIFAVLAVGTAIVVFLVVKNLVAGWTMPDLPGAPIDLGNDPSSITLPDGSQASQPMQSSGGPAAKAWDGSHRVTALLMGLDFRDWAANEPAARTDSMMLVTYDPITNTAGMLSIPRDMWVYIPGFDYAKINTAYYLGEVNQLPGGGPALAVQTVEQFLGVPIDFYAQIDFNSFIKFIDEIGCIDIKVRVPITIDPLGQGNTKTLEPGTQPLCGADALAYARQRHTDGGDFDRSLRQQEVILAVRNQIFNLNKLPEMVSKAPQIYSNIASGLRTNLTMSQVIQLALAAQQVPKENIKQAIIGTQDTQIATSSDGLSILIPNPDRIREVRDSIFASGGPIAPVVLAPTAISQPAVAAGPDDVPATATPIPVADLTTLMVSEQARLMVQNGTQTAGLGERVGLYFQSLGMNVIGTGAADQPYSQMTLVDYSGKPYTMKFLAELLQIPNTQIFSRYDPNAIGDVAIIIGENWQSALPSLP